MNSQKTNLIHKIEQIFANAVISADEHLLFPYVKIHVDSVKEIMTFCLHDTQMQLDFLECLTGIDTGSEFLILYQFFSTVKKHRLNIKVQLNRKKPVVASVSSFWRAAIYYEREAAEMFGILFDDHPSPGNLLLPQDWQGYPLRKDYVYPKEYKGLTHLRPPLRKVHVRP